MGLMSYISGLFKAKPAVEKEAPTALPTKGGRVTLPDYTNLYSLLGTNSIVGQEIPKELLKVISHLAKYNADVSHAVENIVALGNTADNINFGDGISPKKAEKLSKALRSGMKLWYEGGISALRADLLAQVAVYGAVSGEIVPNNSLTGVLRVVLVNPENIEFKYNHETGEHIPCQRVSGLGSVAAMANASYDGLVELNPITYKYFAVRKQGDKPYAIPPFLSALESIKIQRDMMDNFKHVINKLGVMGFLHALVTPPKREPSETVEAYQQRCQRFLADWVMPELEKGLAKGVVVGFKDTHEFAIEGTNTNVSGSRELFNMITEQTMSGLKQDPRLLGRNFSTTETYGKVILTKFTSQIASYQRAVDEFISQIYHLHLSLSGNPMTYVEVESEMPTVSDELNDQQAYEKKISNYITLYNQGIISQQELAQTLGYDKADEPEPRKKEVPTNGNKDNGADGSTTKDEPAAEPEDESEQKAKNNYLELVARIGGNFGSYDYVTTGCSCCENGHEKMMLAGTSRSRLEDFMAKYFAEVSDVLSAASAEVANKIARGLAALPDTTTEQQAIDFVLYNLYENWEAAFTKKQTAIVSRWVKRIYEFYRADTESIASMPNFDPSNPPKAVFNLRDTRTVDYFKKSDKTYLGKFITDDDTVKKLTEFIREAYVGENLPIGSKAPLMEFRKQFTDLLVGEEWKISRIIATTANRLRNYANVAYMNDAAVERYEILGVKDQLQCAHCAKMQGKTFSITKGLDKIDQIIKSEPEALPLISPFLVSTIKDSDDLDNLSGDELQARGIDTPPYHPYCRDRVVGIL
jgi:hypothetical protein